MTRAHSHNPAVHRELDARLDGGGQRGDDVEPLTVATRKRLGAVGWPEGDRGSRTTTWSLNAAEHVAEALYRLGAAPATVAAARKGRVTIGAQRMVRYPGLRTTAQRNLENARRTEVAARVAKRRAQEQAETGKRNVTASRRRASRAAMFALQHGGRHYTQGPRRWDPIRSRANPDTGRMWDYGDCSSFATWVLWHALGRSGPDVVNGTDWDAGYTGTQMQHGVPVTNGVYYPGDLAFYGHPTVGSHVVVCYQAGTGATARWASHGSEGGPYSVKLHYRGDLVMVRRYIR